MRGGGGTIASGAGLEEEPRGKGRSCVQWGAWLEVGQGDVMGLWRRGRGLEV